jgi:hypothetical protein
MQVKLLLRRLLEEMEAMDRKAGIDPPRVTLYTNHRVAVPGARLDSAHELGFLPNPDGTQSLAIEEVVEHREPGKVTQRTRAPGSQLIDLGTPELVGIAQGVHGTDAERLGLVKRPVTYTDLKGHEGVETACKATFIACNLEIEVGGRLRRRASAYKDEQGQWYKLGQIAVGHENDPEVGWCLVRVPDSYEETGMFDRVRQRKVPSDTDPQSQEFKDASQQLIYDFYISQASEILQVPADELRQAGMSLPPSLFTLTEMRGEDPKVAENGFAFADSYANGHFLTSAVER